VIVYINMHTLYFSSLSDLIALTNLHQNRACNAQKRYYDSETMNNNNTVVNERSISSNRI